MKQILLLLISMSFTILACFSAENGNFTVNNNKSYILLIDDTAIEYNFSKPNIIKVVPVVTLDNDRQQVLIQTVNNGSADLYIKTPSTDYKYSFNVADGSSNIYDDLLELDLPDEVVN